MAMNVPQRARLKEASLSRSSVSESEEAAPASNEAAEEERVATEGARRRERS